MNATCHAAKRDRGKPVRRKQAGAKAKAAKIARKVKRSRM